ncbi:hypothetical protein BS17DRAFT_813235 [Gyrodon lividus]|nr:hypothetical protein BS17DRAFT_813235 [Gyrodon lividus]
MEPTPSTPPAPAPHLQYATHKICAPSILFRLKQQLAQIILPKLLRPCPSDPPQGFPTDSAVLRAPDLSRSWIEPGLDTLSQKPPLDLSSKLGKDGRLTSEEHKHHFDLKLCMFCGAMGYMAKDCWKSTSHAAKMSPAPETKPEASTPEAKK